MQKKTIPYTCTNSFFYIENSAEPLEFQPMAPEQAEQFLKNTKGDIEESESELKKTKNLMKQFVKSIKNL